jgi:vacuolar-type H+-ATPase subunit B/Vma2
MRAGARRQKSRLCAAPIFVLMVAALLADAVIAEGRVRRDLTLQTGHLLAAAYQEGRDVGLFW